ncbi:MAG: hypothetical protein ABFD29_05795 [Anaerolineaceae bacterium]
MMTKQKFHYEIDLASMPPGLDRAVLRVISKITAEKPISRDKLVIGVHSLGFAANERQIRETIKKLRRQGYLICATPGENGGYYMAMNASEYQDFRNSEYAAKIKDMSETMRAMDQAAKQQFGDGVQIGLF